MPVPTMDEVAKLSREERVARMARTADDLAAAIAGQPEAVLARRPDPKNWAPKEVVCHLRDAEDLFMQRFQTIMAMENPRLFPPEPDRWAEERQYLRNDVAEALRHFRRWREESLAFLRGLAPADWQRAGTHPTRGRVTVEDFVTLTSSAALFAGSRDGRPRRGRPTSVSDPPVDLAAATNRSPASVGRRYSSCRYGEPYRQRMKPPWEVNEWAQATAADPQ